MVRDSVGGEQAGRITGVVVVEPGWRVIRWDSKRESLLEKSSGFESRVHKPGL